MNVLRDLEDFYANELREQLPPSIVIRQLLFVDHHEEVPGLSLVHDEFRNHLEILVASLAVVARNSKRHGETSLAERLLEDALHLMDLKEDDLYRHPRAVNPNVRLKKKILEMAIDCSNINCHFDACLHYGKVGDQNSLIILVFVALPRHAARGLKCARNAWRCLCEVWESG